MFKWLNLQLGKKKTVDKNALEKSRNTIHLWEREFNIVENGLDKEQVTGFVNNLMEKHNASQEASAASLRSLLQKAVTDAEQLAANIKTKAQTEAQAEAARLIAQARLDTQDIKKKAELAAQKEAEDIIAVANRKAHITGAESRQKALILLLKAREDIEKEVMQEYKSVCSRLSTSLQNLAAEGQDIEAYLKAKRVELWESNKFTLTEHEAAPEISETASPSTDTTAPTTESGLSNRQ